MVSPFDQDPVKKKMFYEWCMTNCVGARPHERDCPDTHCDCYPTAGNLTPSQIRDALKRTDAPTRQQSSARPAASTPVDPNDCKAQATIAIQPVRKNYTYFSVSMHPHSCIIVLRATSSAGDNKYPITMESHFGKPDD